VGGRINRKEETYEDSNEPVALVISGLHANFLLELNAKELDTRVKRENIMAWLEGRGSFFLLRWRVMRWTACMSREILVVGASYLDRKDYR
jgi:hypothetical protein